jgi:phosphoglycerate dehydrogenase-like enzyme
MKLVIYLQVDDDRLGRTVAAAKPMRVVNTASEAEIRTEIKDADAFFGKITAPMLAAATRLRWVQSPTASLEHYVFPELIEHPCVLTNMRGLYSDVIAAHVFGYVLCFARNFHQYLRNQLNARWAPMGGEQERTSFAVGPGVVSGIDRAHMHLADTTLGIIGLGSIGSEVARCAKTFGLRVLAVDPVADRVPSGVESVWKLDRLSDLLGASDFVVIAAPHTPQTTKMFRRPQFQQMKRSAYLINVGRGAIVDLTDLTESLEQKEIAGAGLDVFEIEPLPADHRLWRMENVIITPHIAGVSPRIAERHLAVLLDNVRRFVRGESLGNIVNKAAWF